MFFSRRNTITRGLIAWWTFDTASDTNAPDNSGNGYWGAVSVGGATAKPWIAPGIVPTLDGRPGGSMHFDGVDDYVIGPTLVNTALVTMSVWCRINGNPASQGQLGTFVNGIGNGTADKSLVVSTGGIVKWYVFDGSAKTVTGTKVITDNQWHHVVGVADGTNASIYIDGVSDGSVAAGNTFTGYTLPNIACNGNNAGGGPAAAMLCEEDDFRVYNRGLSQDEIVSLYREVTGALTLPNRIRTPSFPSINPLRTTRATMTW